MVNWQLSKQGIRWSVLHDGTTSSDGNSSRSRVFWKFSADQLLALNWSQTHVYVFSHIYGYGFVDFFPMVWSPLSEVNLKCINGSFVFSSGLSGILLRYRTRNQKAKCIPCRGCALKAEKFTQQIWWYNFKILLFSHSLCLRLSRKVVAKKCARDNPDRKYENNKYTVPDTEAVESIFVAFLKHLQTYFHGFSRHLKNSEF